MGFVVLLMGQSSEWLSILFALSLKSTIMLATALLLAYMLRSASARLRHILWCIALCSLLVLPLFSGGLQPLHLPVLPSGLFPNELATSQQSPDRAVELPGQTAHNLASDPRFQLGLRSQSNLPLVEERPSRSGFPWQSIILLVWLIGMLLVLGRFVVGIVTVRRLAARAREPLGTSWSELLAELSGDLRLKHPVRLLLSDESVMPMTCLGISPFVLLPSDAVHWPAERRRVVILHELIHLKRRDLLTQALSHIVCALYWFNPLVWWAAKRLRIEQEWACDEHVVATGITAPEYATHLLEIARKFHADTLSAVNTIAMARPSQLQERLCAILKVPYERHRSGRMIAVSVVVMSVVFISTAVTQLVTAESQTRPNILNVTNDLTEDEQKENGAHLSEQSMAGTNPPGAPAAEETYALHETPSPTPINQPADRPLASQDTRDNQTEEQVFNSFSTEERDRLINNGIGPAYIREMRDAGYRGLSVAQLIALYSNEVHADDVAALGSVGYLGLSTRDLLALKTNGITPEVIRSFQGVKHADFKATNYIALRSNGVTTSYLKSMNAAGYDSLTAKQIVEMYIAGVTAEFIRDMRSRVNANLSPEELIELKRRERQ